MEKGADTMQTTNVLIQSLLLLYIEEIIRLESQCSGREWTLSGTS